MGAPRVGILGLGYVGLPLAVAFTQHGIKVVGFDTDRLVVDRVNSGVSHVGDVPEEALRHAREQGFLASSDMDTLADLDTYMICVPTPLGIDGLADMSFVDSAVMLLTGVVGRGDLVILESTSPPGTTRDRVGQQIGSITGLVPGHDFCVAFSPERVDPGNLHHSVGNTPKIVAGLAACCTQRAGDLYRELGIEVIEASGLKEAEFAKLLENTYRQVNIALVNEMAKFCHALGIDVHEAIRLASTKPFGFQAFQPGPGVGGHCIPVDPMLLAAQITVETGEDFRLAQLAHNINRSMPLYIVDRFVQEMESRGQAVVGDRLLILGVTYKRDVADTRETPAEAVARELMKCGASIEYCDPYVPQWIVDGTLIPRREISEITGSSDGAEFIGSLLITDHAAFNEVDVSSLGVVVFDTRSFLSGDNVVHL